MLYLLLLFNFLNWIYAKCSHGSTIVAVVANFLIRMRKLSVAGALIRPPLQHEQVVAGK